MPRQPKRVGFNDRKVGKGFIAANIQRAHGDGVGRKGFQLLAIDLLLLAFTGKAIFHHKRHFGAIQPHALRTTL